MDCAAYERGLADLAGGELDGPKSEQLIAALLRHAGACPECTGSVELVQLLALPSAERDPSPLPGDEYWDRFNESVSNRIHATRWFSGRFPRYAYTFAAALLLVGLWAWWGNDLTQDSLTTPTQPAVAVVAAEDPPVFPPRLAEMLRSPTPEALDALELIGGFGGAADPLPMGRSEEETWIDSPRGASWIFPPTDDLDAESRKELTRWLRDQAHASQGVT